MHSDLGRTNESESFDAEAATWDDNPDHEPRQQAVARAIGEQVNLAADGA